MDVFWNRNEWENRKIIFKTLFVQSIGGKFPVAELIILVVLIINCLHRFSQFTFEFHYEMFLRKSFNTFSISHCCSVLNLGSVLAD